MNNLLSIFLCFKSASFPRAAGPFLIPTLLFWLTALAPSPAPADCTLAPTATCNGAPCGGETRPEGYIVYNTDHKEMHYCDGAVWREMRGTGPVCAPEDSVILTSAGYSCQLTACPTSGLLAHWAFNESAGGIAPDTSGNGNHGTLTNINTTTAWVPGKIGNALSFDGSNDFVDLSATPADSYTYDDLTISAWYKSADLAAVDDQYILKSGDDAGVNDSFVFGPTEDAGHGDEFRFLVNEQGTLRYFFAAGIDIVDQTWRHLVATRGGGRVKLYVDGALVTDAPDPITGSIDPTPAAQTYIGDNPGDTEQVKGLLDEIRVYNRALTGSEIALLYNNGAACQ